MVLSAALKDTRSPFELHAFARGGHGFGLRKENDAGKLWPELAKYWMLNMNIL